MLTQGKCNRQLRVGLLIDNGSPPGWAWEMVKAIGESDFAALRLVVVNESAPTVEPLWRRIMSNRSRLLYLAYSWLERKLIKSRAPSIQPKEYEQLIRDVPTIGVRPLSRQFTDSLHDDDIKEIADFELDVLIRLGFRILKGKVLSVAKHGVWSLHHGDNRVNRGMPPGFWEVFENWPESGVVLQILSDELDGGQQLCRSTSMTIQPFVSLNLEAYNWKAMLFIPRMLRRLHDLGPDVFFADVQKANAHPAFYCGSLYSIPGNTRMASLFFRSTMRYIANKLRNAFYLDQWQLLYSRNSAELPAMTLRRFTPLVPPKDRFWADPHVVDKAGTSYIFFEELPFKSGKGHISVISIDAEGNTSAPQIVLDRPYHLSYPFVFEIDDKYYMIPETAANKTIELYECTRFPDQWQFVMNLMENVLAVDATVFHDQDRWWLFANMMQHPGVSPLDELFAFHAEQFPTSDWTPHAANPLVSDVSSARPAGAFFKYNGNLYRPSQNSSGRYGRSINIQHVSRLSIENFDEQTVNTIDANWRNDLLGTHTISISKKLTVVDVEVRRSRFF